MLLENHPYPQDTRVRHEAGTLVEAGHDVTVIAPRGAGQTARAVIDGVTIQRFPVPLSGGTRSGYVREYAAAHLQLLTRVVPQLLRGATVVHLHNPPDTLFPAAYLARALGRRAVFDLHDLAPELYVEKFGESWLVGLLRAAQRISLRSADAVLVTNESQREVASRVAARVVVVRNGPSTAGLRDVSPPRDGELRDPRLLFVGNLEKQDGALMLPALLASLHREHDLPGARLTVAGDGLCLRELRDRTTAEQLDPYVELLGRVPHARIPDLMAAADICLEPAPASRLNHRSSMIKVAEYLVAGRPVVAYDLVETRRTAGDAALYARCNDEAAFAGLVARLARQPAARRQLAALARERAGELTWKHSAERLVELYLEL
jgi:glycosyltransferase involved in cell wall biosynthesis